MDTILDTKKHCKEHHIAALRDTYPTRDTAITMSMKYHVRDSCD